MQKINAGLYKERKSVTIDGKSVDAEFQVYKLKDKDPKNPKRFIELPIWAWDCPELKILPTDVYEHKKDAISAMNRSCDFGFKTVNMQAVMLAIQPN